MKKFKLLTSLAETTTLSGAIAITNTSCSNNEYEIIVSRDVDFIGVAPKAMQEGTGYEQNVFMPVPVMIPKDGVQQNVTKANATTNDKDKITIGPAQEGTTNTFTVYGKSEGNATINIEAETDSGYKMSTSVNITIKSFDKCGYIRYTSWEDFFVWAQDFTSGIFPVDKSLLPVTVVNSPDGIKDFIKEDYVSVGMFTEGMFLTMFNQLCEAAGSIDVKTFNDKWTFKGGQIYWRTT